MCCRLLFESPKYRSQCVLAFNFYHNTFATKSDFNIFDFVTFTLRIGMLVCITLVFQVHGILWLCFNTLISQLRIDNDRRSIWTITRFE